METVRLRLKDQYAMPLVCCACGAPAGAERLSVSAGTYKRSVSIAFPLCDRCAHATSTVERRRGISCWGALGLSVFLCIGAIGIGIALGVDSDTASASFDNLIGGLLLLAVLTLVAGLVTQWLVTIIGLAPEVRRAYKQASKAARIKSYNPGFIGRGSITFALRNDQFASLFKEMNAEAVVGVTAGEWIARMLGIAVAVVFSIAGFCLLYSGIVLEKLVLGDAVIEKPVLIAFGLVMLVPLLGALLRLVVATLARAFSRGR